MNDVLDPLILVGGPGAIQDLVKQYAALKGWQRVQTIHFEPADEASRASWSRKTGQALLEMSRPGDKILIFLPEHLHQGWVKTLEACGRQTEIPLHDLPMARQIMVLYHWMAVLERSAGSQAEIQSNPPSRLAGFLNKFKMPALFPKKRPRRSSPAPHPD